MTPARSLAIIIFEIAISILPSAVTSGGRLGSAANAQSDRAGIFFKPHRK
jgi:hypothetical protein